MLDIHVEGDGEFSICRPAGEIDSYTVDSFREALGNLVSVPQLLIDLSEVPFMDSAGLGALIGAIRKAGENDGVVSLLQISHDDFVPRTQNYAYVPF